MLRTHFKKDGLNERFLGFGDPVYDYESYRSGKPETGEEETSGRSASGQWTKSGYLRAGGRLTRLVGSGKEIKEIGDIFQIKELPGKTLLRTDAREENAKSPETQNYGYIHFSTHGILTPNFQAIALSHIPHSSEDGFFTLGEIMNSRFNARLVVLSACETGLGQIDRGEGVTGLTRAVMYAGSPAAVVSLWSVSDEGTKELMVNFYKNMIEKGIGKEESLRLAKMEMIREKGHDAKEEAPAKGDLRSVKITERVQVGAFNHPFYWSAFVMYGE
jgi:CHAT domain-containing protein